MQNSKLASPAQVLEDRCRECRERSVGLRESATLLALDAELLKCTLFKIGDELPPEVWPAFRGHWRTIADHVALVRGSI